MRSSRRRVTMENYKTKVIQADLDIFAHIQAYSDMSRHIQPGIIRHSEAYVILTNSEPEAYSEPWSVLR